MSKKIIMQKCKKCNKEIKTIREHISRTNDTYSDEGKLINLKFPSWYCNSCALEVGW